MPNVLSIRIFLFAMCSLWFLGVAEARPLYPIELPFQQFSCSTCHDGATSTASINEFAKDFRDAGYTWTEALCQEDSDGDGASNGEELLDPDCTWMRGQAVRMGMANRPSDATDVPESQAVEGSEDEGAQDDTDGANDNEPPGAPAPTTPSPDSEGAAPNDPVDSAGQIPPTGPPTESIGGTEGDTNGMMNDDVGGENSAGGCSVVPSMDSHDLGVDVLAIVLAFCFGRRRRCSLCG